jgi:hypothetical protein
MANNQKVFEGHHIPLPVGVGKLSGDPVVCGKLVGICETNADANGMATVDISGGVYALSVGGINAGGNVAVLVGDTVYYTSSDTPKVNARVAGVEFGTVIGTSFPYSAAIGTTAVTAGGTATVHVKLRTL